MHGLKRTACYAALCAAIMSSMATSVRAQEMPQASTLPPEVSFDIGGGILVLKPKKDVKLDASQQAFMEKYIAAVNTDDLDAFKALLLPASRSCADAVEPAFRDHYYRLQLRFTVPEDYLIVFDPLVQKYDPDFQAAQDAWYKDPAVNTHTMMLTYIDPKTGSDTISHKLYKAKDGYQLILGCPTKVTVENFTRDAEAEKKAAAEAQEIMASLDDKVKADILEALGKNDHMAAMKRFEEAYPGKSGISFRILETLRRDAQISDAPLQLQPATSPPAVATLPDKEQYIKYAVILALIFVGALVLLRLRNRAGKP